MQQTIQLRLLGTVQFEQAGKLIYGFESRKAIGLLGYLMVRRQAISRSYLAHLFWGNLPEAKGRANLSRVLYNLGRQLPDCLQKDRHTVQFQLTADYWLDLEAFEDFIRDDNILAIEKAVSLYRDEFMAGLYLNDCPEFETWLVTERERWLQRLLQALYKLVEHYTQRGAYDQGLQYVSQLLDLDPGQEEAHRQKIILLAQSGQRSAALAQYETCCRVLADTLGVEPAPETLRLYQKIYKGELGKVSRSASDAGEVSKLPKVLSSAPTQPAISTSFVARSGELARLEEFLEITLADRGRVVFVTGEAGSGKTALVQEFVRRAQTQVGKLIVAGGHCNAYDGIGDPYLPFREIVGLLIGDTEFRQQVERLDREQARRLQVFVPDVIEFFIDHSPDLMDVFVNEAVLARQTTAHVSETVAGATRFGDFMAKRAEAAQRPKPQQTDLFEQFTEMIQAIACRQPLLLILDDLQWADRGTLSLLFHLGRRIVQSRILIIGIYRPSDVAIGRDGQRHPLETVVNEYQRTFGNIEVDLDQAHGQPFIDALLDREKHRLSDKFRQVLYRRTRGHALFTIEMLRGMKERGDLVQDKQGYWVERDHIDWDNLPARVEGIIKERIHRLSSNLQNILRIACVEGGNFVAEVVAQVRSLEKRHVIEQLSQGLDKQHGLVQHRGSQRLGDQQLSVYRFRHILFQVYLYHNLDPAERIYLHQSVAEVLEQLYGQHTQEIAVQLARHFQAAGLIAKAIDYLHQAGERAIKLSANEEAIAHFKKGLALLDEWPASSEKARRELRLQLALIVPLTAMKGYAAPEVGHVHARSQVICDELGQLPHEVPELFPTLRTLWVFHFSSGNLQAAMRVAQQTLAIAKQMQDMLKLAFAHNMLGSTLVYVGNLKSGVDSFEYIIKNYTPQLRHASALTYFHNPKVIALIYAASGLTVLGFLDQALEYSRQAIALARQEAHPFGLTHALIIGGAMVYQLRGERREAQAYAEEGIKLASNYGFTYWWEIGRIFQSRALVKDNQAKTEVAQMQEALAGHRKLGARIGHSYYRVLLAEACSQIGQPEAGLRIVTEVFAFVQETGEEFCMAELHRLQGEFLLVSGSVEQVQVEAEACFHQAIDIARQNDAKLWELQAVVSLSRLWQQQGRGAEAFSLLAEIYGWFTEGLNTPILHEAKLLLNELTFTKNQSIYQPSSHSPNHPSYHSQ